MPAATASASSAVRRCRTSDSRRGRKPRVASRARPAPKTAASPTELFETTVGAVGVELDQPATAPVGLLALGHGAGGGVEAPDLLAATRAALDRGWAVARVTQPYRLAGRRAPAPAVQLDAAWREGLTAIRRPLLVSQLPLVVGGRSSGARVACRTAKDLGAAAVVALAFPLHPPGRPERSRADELRNVGAPVHVVQGERDAFGSPDDVSMLKIRGVRVTAVPAADHSLRTADAKAAVVDVVAQVLQSLTK